MEARKRGWPSEMHCSDDPLISIEFWRIAIRSRFFKEGAYTHPFHVPWVWKHTFGKLFPKYSATDIERWDVSWEEFFYATLGRSQQVCELQHQEALLFSFIAAAAAKSLQSCPTLCDPIDGSPPGSAVPGILQARTLKWVAISFSNAWKWKVKVKSLSCVRVFVTSWTAAHQAPPSMGFSRQEYWSGVPLPSPV